MSKFETNDFNFFVPAEAIISKSGDGKDDRRLIQGIASTDDLDLQNEKVVQSGIDTSYFLKHGWINDDHKPGVENKVGEPLEARITKAGLWIKAFLLKGKERADYWWEHITSLEASGSKRKVGFSIQGKVQRRDGNSITKCWLQDVAITASPVNTSTWGEIVKSLSGERWCLHPWRPIEKACKGCPGNPTCADDEDEEKGLSVAGGGGMLIPQSLEGKEKVSTYKSMPDVITYDQAVQYLQKEKNMSPVVAKVVADSIFSINGVR